MGKTSRQHWLVAILAGAVLLSAVGWLALLALTNLTQTPVTLASSVSSVSIESQTVAPDDSITVNVTAEATDLGIGAYTIDVVYDDSLLTATACTSTAGPCNEAFAPDTVCLSGFSASGLTGAVDLGTITFLAGSTEGVSDLDVQVVQLADPEGNPVTAGAVNDGSITIDTPKPTLTPGKEGLQWGMPTDIPVPGDYDGDGCEDLAVWRPSNGNWYVHPDRVGVHWGVNGDIPVPGDYDGDGDTDFAVWRPSNGKWYVFPN